jgi:hypothetical protein
MTDHNGNKADVETEIDELTEDELKRHRAIARGEEPG